jgi:hypothetical protein
LWINFNIVCEKNTQIILHKIFYKKIIEWEKEGLSTGAVLTYHFFHPRKPKDSLYLCLKIPSVKEPKFRTNIIPKNTKDEIPKEILQFVYKTCLEHKIVIDYDEKNLPFNYLEIIDYEYVISQQYKKFKNLNQLYYRNASVNEVFKFASIGTKIAIEIMSALYNEKNLWTTDQELAKYILFRLKEELGESYFWIKEGFHFVRNPLLINEKYLWDLANTNQNVEKNRELENLRKRIQ